MRLTAVGKQCLHDKYCANQPAEHETGVSVCVYMCRVSAAGLLCAQVTVLAFYEQQ